mmetsp:Transcript_93743/g.180898  ORF Transcript_93743/g.180898 Transcript_93743/m.180898 type:complete len:97 (-) Transcript_93743:666-956(-)
MEYVLPHGKEEKHRDTAHLSALPCKLVPYVEVASTDPFGLLYLSRDRRQPHAMRQNFGPGMHLTQDASVQDYGMWQPVWKDIRHKRSAWRFSEDSM